MSYMKKLLIPLLIFFSFSCSQNGSKTPIVSDITKDTVSKTDNDSIKILIGTYLGTPQRNYYGINPPSALRVKWRTYLGYGYSSFYRAGKSTFWSGTGWTGQPLLTLEYGKPFIYQGSLDHNLKKIDALTGDIIWEYKFDDVIKGTGTLYKLSNSVNEENRYCIVQGSRRGATVSMAAPEAYSLRSISILTGKEVWRYNVKHTRSVSRDADGSPLFLNDTIFAPLENGIFSVLDPDSTYKIKNWNVVSSINEIQTFTNKDRRNNLIIESSPTLLGGLLYLPSGSGYVYGYDLSQKNINWKFYIGADLNGTAAVTADSCLLISVEKQYIAGLGGVAKLDPSKGHDSVQVWYMPVFNKGYSEWDGGVIGTAGVNTLYKKINNKDLAVILSIDGYLYLIDSKQTSDKNTKNFDGVSNVPSPVLYDKLKTGASISSPIIIDDKVIACSYYGIYLLKINDNLKFELIDFYKTGFESTPIVYANMIFIGSRDGYLYCFGN
jgi:outer membrane protein assembly factor BamB